VLACCLSIEKQRGVGHYGPRGKAVAFDNNRETSFWGGGHAIFTYPKIGGKEGGALY